MLSIMNAIFGGALLLAGRKLFWLFVAVLGFLAGFQFTSSVWQGPEGLAIIVGLVIGIIFALLAIFLQAIAIGIAGFLAGGYILTVLANMIGLEAVGALSWIIYIAGGVIGVILVSFLFDWAIITLSSLAGASLVVEAFLPERAMGNLIFFILFVIGVVVQGSTLRTEKAAVVSS